jgi:hypothetical protein
MFPTLRQISTRVRASRALDGTVTWLRGIYASRVMTTACALQHFDMAEYADDS